MPSIKLTDDDGQQLLSVNLSGRAGWGRYLRSALGLRAFVPTRRRMAAPLTDRAGTGQDVEFDVTQPVDMGGVGLRVAAGGRAGVGVHAPESPILPASDLRTPLLAPSGTAMMSWRLRTVLSAGTALPHGAASLGFEAGTGLSLAYFHPFDLSGPEPSFGDALQTTLQAAVVPADVDDLAAMAPGAVVSLSGEGHISLAGTATLSALANPLATPGLPLVGTVGVKASATASLGAEWRLSGQFERRVARVSASRVRIEYFSQAGRDLKITAQTTAGIAVTARDAELLSVLMRAISSDPEADLVALVNAGLTNDQIESLQRAIAFSVNRSLTVAAEAQLALRRRRGALFSYDVDLAELTAASRAAVGQALQGSLSAIEQGGPGITAGPTGTLALREQSARWRLNLFGVLNAASISTFVRSGTSLYDPASGALQLADTVSRSRIAVAARPFEADAQKVRKVTFESLTVTAAYQASRLLPLDLALTAQHSYVEQRARTGRRDMEDHFRAIVGLGLCTPAEAAAAIGDRTDFGPSTLMLDCRFDRTACDALFLDSGAQPHDEDHYDRIGREAMLALVPADDPERAHRRWPLERPDVWRQMRAAGADLASALPGHIRSSPARLAAVRDDFLTIVFWASAMRRAAVALAAMRSLLGGRAASGLGGDAAFEKARRTLEETLAGVVSATESQFGDPWDVLVLEAASGSTAAVQAIVVSREAAASFEAAPAARAARAIPEGVVPEARAVAWTSAQRAIFERHVVNLRQGELSGDGSFLSSKAQVEAIFREHLPAALAEARVRGDRLRIVFYAHGGLTDEIGGLRMPVARHAFWKGNHVYPIYFVWETGFRETLSDLLGGLLGRRPGLEGIGDIADAAIERGARLGGRPVWSAMKTSAAKAVASAGGATLVSKLTAELWRAESRDLELHAIGHSAGSIFHAHFLPQLLAHKMPAGTPSIGVQSLHFLAPAATNGLFKKTLLPIIGPGKPIHALTMYTMRDDLERADPSVPAYGKSLLYLVRAAFEDKAPTELVGLEISLKADLDLIRFFGLGGREQRADVVFSTTAPGAPLASRSSSVEHGAFDNDADTMNSVMRRILGVPDQTKIVDYAEEPVPEAEREAVVTEGLQPTRSRGARLRAATGRRRPTRAARAQKRWTILVWMAGDNNLESFGDKDLLEMKRVGSTDDVDVVVQFDRQTDDRTRRYHVKASGTVDDDVVEELGETNTGDPDVAVDFFTWGMKRFPADRVLTVLWNHGSGVDDTDIYARATRGARGGVRGPAPSTREAVRAVAASRHRRALFSTTIDAALGDRAIAFDDTSRDFIDTVELKKVLAGASKAAGRPIDLVGFDACLMSMVEIAHQLRGTAGYLVGSEEIEPGDGWPYDRVLEALAANPDMTAAGLGTAIVDAFVASYASGKITQSLFALDRVGPLATAVDRLAKALIAAIATPAEFVAVAQAINGVQRFHMPDFADLADFCDEVRTRTKTAAVRKAADGVKAALAAPDGLIAHSRRKGTAVERASGAAIYLPTGNIAAPYGRLDFAKQTAWRKLLAALRAS